MAVHVLEMSTDQDILNTQLHHTWNTFHGGVAHRRTWAQVHQGGLNIPHGAIILVIAHGNGDEIGNANPDTGVDITPADFIHLIQNNMQNQNNMHAQPDAIYISTCGTGHALFAAHVVNLLDGGGPGLWLHTTFFGHNDAVAGNVPSPHAQFDWTQIFLD